MNLSRAALFVGLLLTVFCSCDRKQPVEATSPPATVSTPTAPPPSPPPPPPASEAAGQKAAVPAMLYGTTQASFSVISLDPKRPPAPAELKAIAEKAGLAVLEGRPKKDSAKPFVAYLVQPFDNAFTADELAQRAQNLSPEQLAALKKRNLGFSLAFVNPQGIPLDVVARQQQTLPVYRNALGVLRDLTRGADVVIVDEDANYFYSSAQVAVLLEDWEGTFPLVSRHVRIETYVDEAPLHRIVTGGMGKFGIPDLVVERVPAEQTARMEALVRLAAQTLVEGAQLNLDGEVIVAIDRLKHKKAAHELKSVLRGGKVGAGAVKLGRATLKDGDPKNHLKEIVFPGTGAPQHQAQSALLDEMFGR